MTACPFCDLRPDSIVAQDEHAVALRDRYPAADGHTLVIPRRHVESAFDLGAHELASLWELVGRVRDALAAELAADAFTIGLNDGIAAGQTVMHAHVHVIPRRAGDVEDPRGGIRWVIPARAAYWSDPAQ
jgi:diadenosine tetraphosphate (Ap4A) HIT family hydrolase